MMAAFEAALYDDWMALSITVAAIAVIISAMLIVLSRMFALKSLEQAAKAELIFAISTVVIVTMTAFLIMTGESVLVGSGEDVGVLKAMYLASLGCSESSPIVLPEQTVIDVVELYMKPPKDCAVSMMDTLYILSIPVEASASVYTEVFMSEVLSGFGMKPVAERIRNTATMLIFYLYVYYILIYVLKFIKYFAGFFFSIGVILRAFPPTRGAGAYLMAAAVGFYFIFPLTYVMFATISMPHAWESTELTSYTGAAGGDAYCSEEMRKGHFDEICSVPELTELREASCGSGDWQWVNQVTVMLRANRDKIISLFDADVGTITSLFKRLINSICVVPIVALVVTMTFILNGTNLFGGNIPEIGRGLVKLI